MSDDPDTYSDLERALTRLVRRAFLPTTGDATRRAAGVNLERATYVTLVRISDLDGGRLSDIAAALGVEASTTSRHVKRLVDAGYVEVTNDPDDGRARRYTPTKAGRDALARVRRARRAHLGRALGDWNEQDVADLARGLDQLIDALEADERARA